MRRVLTREEARAIARVHLDSMERPDLPLVLVDESTVEGPDAFVFSWQSRAYFEDPEGAWDQLLLGNVPIRVDRATGEIRMLSREASPKREAGLEPGG